MRAFLLVLAGLAVLGRCFGAQSLDSDRKVAIKDAINGVLVRAEARKFPAAPPLSATQKNYPQLKILEDNYPVIREECARLPV
jgi:hypothetical protein